jgi:hypothetical protein
MPHTMRKFIASVLCWSFGLPVFPQSGSPSNQFAIRVLEGNAAEHNILSRTGAITVIQVRDSRGDIIPGAQVTFSVPTTGAGGTFANGEQTIALKTNLDGIAGTSGFVPNGTPGKFPLTVAVTIAGVTERLDIWQSNSLNVFSDGVPKAKSHWKIWLAAATAAAGAGLYFAVRGRGSLSPGWTPGPPQIGAPR